MASDAVRFVRRKRKRKRLAAAETTCVARCNSVASRRASALYPIVAFFRFSRNDADVTASTGHRLIIIALFFFANEVLS